jgi:hypothetical protein
MEGQVQLGYSKISLHDCGAQWKLKPWIKTKKSDTDITLALMFSRKVLLVVILPIKIF